MSQKCESDDNGVANVVQTFSSYIYGVFAFGRPHFELSSVSPYVRDQQHSVYICFAVWLNSNYIYLSKGLLFLFNEIGIEKPQIKNPEIRFVRADQEALTILPSYFALM